MQKFKEGMGPFFQPAPDEHAQDGDAAGGGNGKEIASDPISETTHEIALLTQQHEGGAIDSIRYIDSVLPCLARREDRIRHHYPKNEESIKKIIEGKGVRLSAILHDFNYGDIVDATLYPLSGMSDEMRKTRTLVRAVAEYPLLYSPFIHALTMSKRDSRVKKIAPSSEYSFQHNAKEISTYGLFWGAVLPFPETLNGHDTTKRKGVAALGLLATIAERKMLADVADLTKKPGSVSPRAAEDFWEHHLIGKPGDEGVIFCRNYAKAVRDRMVAAALDEYGGTVGNRVVALWNALINRTRALHESSDLEREGFLKTLDYITEQLIAGNIQNAERAFKKSSEERPSMQPDTASEKIRDRRPKPRISEQEALEYLQTYDAHLLINIESLKNRTGSIEFLYVALTSVPQTSHDMNRTAPRYSVLRVLSQKKYTFTPLLANLPSPGSLMNRIDAGIEYCHELKDAYASGQTVSAPRLSGGKGALLDLGPLEDLSQESVHTAVENFFTTEIGQFAFGDRHERIINESEEEEEEEDRALQELLSHYHHVFVRPIRKIKGSNPLAELSMIYILGVVSARNVQKEDRINECRGTIGAIKDPVLFFRRITFSRGGKILQNQVSHASSFALTVSKFFRSTAVDMGAYDTLTINLAHRLRDEYNAKKSADQPPHDF